MKVQTRFKVLVGQGSRDLEDDLNRWVGEMEQEYGGLETPGGKFALRSVTPMPMDGELLYVLAEYNLYDGEPA